MELSFLRPVVPVAAIGLAVFVLAWPGLSLAVDSPHPAMGHAESEGLIFERQQIMLQLEKDSELLGNIVAGIEPASKLAGTTAAIATGAKDAAASFADRVPGGRSKPEVWSNNADFTARMQAFAANAEAMAQAGRGGNVASVIPLLIDALPCKQCHDTYREAKKP